MYRIKYVLAVLMTIMHLLHGNITFAAEHYDEECSYSTGMIWELLDQNATYEISDYDIADIIHKKDGTEQVKFNRPGDLYVTAWIPELELKVVYLMHITGQPVDETAVNRENFAQDVLDLVNQERAMSGCEPLRLTDDLSRFASIRAEEISRHYSHRRPDGRPFHTVFEKAKGRFYGENIAAGAISPQQVVEMWMNSKGHRKNILYSDYQELGVGYLYLPGSEYGHYWVQLFRGN